jgi:hypothetical protein
MQIVPRRFELMAVKRPFGLVACVDDPAVAALDDDARGLEHRPFVLADEVHRQQLPLGVGFETNVLEDIRFALNVPEGPGDGGVDGDRIELIPPVQAAVRDEGALE